MNKEEILARAKQENVYGDEREKKIRIHRDAFSCWGVLALGTVIMVIKLFRGESPADIISLFFCMAAMGSLYNAAKSKGVVLWAVTAALFGLSGFFFYRFCVGMF